MNRTIMLCGREITYTLEYKKVKNINLHVRRDGTVYVSANKRVSVITIEKFLVEKSMFILSALDKYAEIESNAINEHKFVTGESFRYLGRELRLIVTQGNESVTSDGIYLYLSLPDTDDFVIKSKLIDKWYDNECKEVFAAVISEIYPIFQKFGISMPQVKMRNMTSRWGSCQYKKGSITLNKRLIETSRECIEYVVMHEFAHFLHHNHSKMYYETLAALMPDWKERKKQLEGCWM